MRTHLLLFLSLLLGIHEVSSAKNLSLTEAWTSPLIEGKIQGIYLPGKYSASNDGNGQYYGKCIEMSFSNKDTQWVNIQVPLGQVLDADDGPYQNMIIAQGREFNVYPGGEVTVAFYAFCAEMYDRAPSEHASFQPGRQASTQESALLEVIARNQQFNEAGQHAVWALMNTPRADILNGWRANRHTFLNTLSLLRVSGALDQIAEKEAFWRNYARKDEEASPAPLIGIDTIFVQRIDTLFMDRPVALGTEEGKSSPYRAAIPWLAAILGLFGWILYILQKRKG